MHSVKEYTHTHTLTPPRHIWMWGTSSSWHPKPAFSMFNTYSCHWRLPLCVLTHLLLVSHPLPPLPFLYWLSLLPGARMKLKQVTGHSSNLLSSFPFFAFSYSRSPSLVFPPQSLRLATSFGSQRQEKWRRQTWQQNTAKLPCPHSLVQQPTLPLQWAFIEYQDSNNSRGMKLTQFLIEKRFV